MKSLPIGEFKAHLSEVIERVQQGESFGITYGKNRKLVAEINPPRTKKKAGKRKLGILEGKVKYVFSDDFKMTEEEFINLGK